jgi:hypothetical protein
VDLRQAVHLEHVLMGHGRLRVASPGPSSSGTRPPGRRRKAAPGAGRSA